MGADNQKRPKSVSFESEVQPRLSTDRRNSIMSVVPKITLNLPVMSIRPVARITTNAAKGYSNSRRSFAEERTAAFGRDSQAQYDPRPRREQATDSLYIKAKEQSIMLLLREKIAAQEAILAKDRAILAAMESQYAYVQNED